MLATETCPICGTDRTGSFRFCRSCGLDFDADAPNAESAPLGIVGSEPATDAAPAAAATSVSTTTEEPGPAQAATAPPASDAIVIQKRHLRLAAGIVIGGLIGSMIGGALIVPRFDESLAAVGAAAGVLTIVAGALIGMRVAARQA